MEVENENTLDNNGKCDRLFCFNYRDSFLPLVLPGWLCVKKITRKFNPEVKINEVIEKEN